MAVTKILVVRNKLSRMIDYANNPDKTSLMNALDYATDAQKMETSLMQSVMNCMPDTAYYDMRDTKRRWDKEDGVQAYHIIQAFEHGEVTPHIAHEIGCEFARRLFADRFEVVVATHLDKAHLHNHIVINSVSFVDGKKYRSNIGSYYRELRQTSDAICREYSLSVTQGERRGKHYGEWKRDREDQVVWRDVIRRDIDMTIRHSLSLQQFYSKLRAQGYAIDVNPNHKYVAVRAPGMERAVRLTAKSLGSDYTPEAIAKRILRIPYIDTDDTTHKRFRVRGSHKPMKLKGLRALYFRYMYELGYIKKRPRRTYMSKELRAEVRKLDTYAARLRMLNDHRIETMEQVRVYRGAARDEIIALTDKRTSLHREKERSSETTRRELSRQTEDLTERIRKLRAEIKLCDAMEDEHKDLPVRLERIMRVKGNAIALGQSNSRQHMPVHSHGRLRGESEGYG